MAGLRLDVGFADHLILAICFVTVLGAGFAARRAITSSADFFLSGVTVIGVLDGPSELEKAQGVRINLLMGLGMACSRWAC